MPKIKITEIDTSTAGTLDVTTNAVYIPGYAITGPVNEPILCNTLEEFQQTFGSEPYKYALTEESQSDANIPWKVTEGESEKSYIFASDLIRLGLPILYERITADNSYDNPALYATGNIYKTGFTGDPERIFAKLQATDKTYAGSPTGKIWYTLSSVQITIPSGETTAERPGYTLTVGRDEDESTGTSKIDGVETKFTLVEKVHLVDPTYKYISDSELSGFYENSGLIKLSEMNRSNWDWETISDKRYLKLKDGNLFTPDDLFTYLEDNTSDSGISKLEDKGEYVFKFITAGGYPSMNTYSTPSYFSIADNIIKIASNRGDITAMLDFYQEENPDFESIRSTINGDWAVNLGNNARGEGIGTYGGIPACKNLVFNSPTTKKQETMSPVFAWLSAFANSVTFNENWYACAGTQRGIIPNLVSKNTGISNALSEKLQPRTNLSSENSVSLIPIILVKPYGVRVWGNRTLKANHIDGDLTASSFMNIRQLANDVKRTIWVACKRCTFDQNDNVLWVNFKAQITPLLDRMVGNNGISNYKITRLTTDKKATIVARVTLFCIEAVEDFDITVELTDSQITLIQ